MTITLSPLNALRSAYEGLNYAANRIGSFFGRAVVYCMHQPAVRQNRPIDEVAEMPSGVLATLRNRASKVPRIAWCKPQNAYKGELNAAFRKTFRNASEDAINRLVENFPLINPDSEEPLSEYPKSQARELLWDPYMDITTLFQLKLLDKAQTLGELDGVLSNDPDMDKGRVEQLRKDARKAEGWVCYYDDVHLKEASLFRIATLAGSKEGVTIGTLLDLMPLFGEDDVGGILLGMREYRGVDLEKVCEFKGKLPQRSFRKLAAGVTENPGMNVDDAVKILKGSDTYSLYYVAEILHWYPQAASVYDAFKDSECYEERDALVEEIYRLAMNARSGIKWNIETFVRVKATLKDASIPEIESLLERFNRVPVESFEKVHAWLPEAAVDEVSYIFDKLIDEHKEFDDLVRLRAIFHEDRFTDVVKMWGASSSLNLTDIHEFKQIYREASIDEIADASAWLAIKNDVEKLDKFPRLDVKWALQVKEIVSTAKLSDIYEVQETFGKIDGDKLRTISEAMKVLQETEFLTMAKVLKDYPDFDVKWAADIRAHNPYLSLTGLLFQMYGSG